MGLRIDQNIAAMHAYRNLSVTDGQMAKSLFAVRNAQDGISVVQTAEGAMNEVHSILGRMRDLAVQAVAAENLSASASRIRDTDMAQEMVSFTRSQILT